MILLGSLGGKVGRRQESLKAPRFTGALFLLLIYRSLFIFKACASVLKLILIPLSAPRLTPDSILCLKNNQMVKP